MGVFNFIAFLGALVLAFAGWEARGYLDHHPVWDITVPAPARWVLPDRWKHLHVDTLAGERDRALEAAKLAVDAGAKCQSDISSLKTAQTAQKAAVDALRRESEARLAQSAKATQAARAVAQSYRLQAAQILQAKPVGDVCTAADRLIEQETSR